MSAETTAKVLARMLENKPYRTQVATDPNALAQLDLTDEERSMLVGTAKEGVDKLLQPSGQGGSAEKLAQYLGGARVGLSRETKSELTKAALERMARKGSLAIGHIM
ncbi:MAG TPA: hypothetical protein PKW35_25260 [Nannocystaceae bacterium]|nr:hypothetical protein [Nannocystaceae bacterium]